MTIADRINQSARRLPAWPLYAIGALFPVVLFWRGATGGLGVEPVEVIEAQLGLTGLKLIILGLCVSPLRRFLGVNLVKYRRAIGLVAFFYILLHLVVWIALDMGLRWEQALGDIVKRPYITVGMLGFLAMVPLAMTSNDRAVRQLGALRWQRLQKLVYVVALAGGVHYLWVLKAGHLQAWAYLAVIFALLALRLLPKRQRAAA